MSDVTAAELHGSVAPEFEGVADAFLGNFRDGAEIGAACCVIVGGEPVVDVWAGDADREARRPWTRDTLVNVFSCTKDVPARCDTSKLFGSVMGGPANLFRYDDRWNERALRAGGSLSFADPERDLAFGYVTNRMELSIQMGERATRLVAAAYAALGE